MHPLRDQAIALRIEGKSFNEISAELGIGKGTLSYMLRDVPVPEQAQRKLAKRVTDNQKRFGRMSRATSAAQRSARGVKGGKACWEKHSDTLRKNLSLGRAVSLVTYRKDELPIKHKLERLYGTSFHKELVLGQAVDFVSDALLIEHSRDCTRGLQEMIARFEKLAADRRRKIAYINMHEFGPKRRARLEAVVDEIIDYRALA